MSQSILSMADWLVRLESYSPHEIELGLERVLDVIERLDITPPRQVLHVAGTNGKGSSVALAQALLSESGAIVGTYTSPHVTNFNERVNVAGTPVSDAEIIAAFEQIDAGKGDVALTYFEFATIAALLVFEARSVDIAVLEVGMGGRLDAVNAVEPTAGLITNIALDHCDWLGDDVESIAVEKAGIMRAGKSTVFASRNAPVAIEDQAKQFGADLILAGRDYDWMIAEGSWNWRGRHHSLVDLWRPSLSGDFQIGNAAGVLALLESAGFEELLDVDVVNRAFSKPALPGRLQRIQRDREWLLDVAHNPAAAAVLAETLKTVSFSGSTVAIIAMLDDKDVDGIVSSLADCVDYWIAVKAESGRAIPAGELGRQIANLTNKACLVCQSLTEAIDHARRLTTTQDRILATGSFYVVGPVLEALEIYSPGMGES
jgi:dihydrofolate synthase/folylpolyglutamate synthase